VGDRIRTGQVIAVLDTHLRRQAAAQEAKAKQTVAAAKLEQTQAGPKPDDVRAQQAQVGRSEAELHAAERDLRRVSLLLRRDASSRQELEDQALKVSQSRESLNQAVAQLAAIKSIRPADIHVAQAELAQAEASMAVAQAELEATEVRSPIGGR